MRPRLFSINMFLHNLDFIIDRFEPLLGAPLATHDFGCYIEERWRSRAGAALELLLHVGWVCLATGGFVWAPIEIGWVLLCCLALGGAWANGAGRGELGV